MISSLFSKARFQPNYFLVLVLWMTFSCSKEVAENKSVSISVRDYDTHIVLKNVKIRLFNEAGDYVLEGLTDGNGQFKHAFEGEYKGIIAEKDAFITQIINDNTQTSIDLRAFAYVTFHFLDTVAPIGDTVMLNCDPAGSFGGGPEYFHSLDTGFTHTVDPWGSYFMMNYNGSAYNVPYSLAGHEVMYFDVYH